MLKRGLFLILAVLMVYPVTTAGAIEYGAEVNPNNTQYAQTFTDVPSSHWAFQFIGDLTARGAINGYPDGRFYPEKTVTREEFAKIMIVAAGVAPVAVGQSSYTDVAPTYWASPFIEAAKPYMTAYQSANGLAFYPTRGALREDMAVAVVKLKGYDTRLADLGMLRTMFSDVDSISASAQPYVALAVENALISGYPDGTFGGQRTITRAEGAAILWRAFQYGNDQKVIPGDSQQTTPGPTVVPTPATQNPAAPTPTPAPSVPTPPATTQTPTQPNGPSEAQPTPSQEPVPSEEPQAKYTLETLAQASGVKSMVVTQSGDIYFLQGGQVKVVTNGQTSTVADPSSNFQYSRVLSDIAQKIEDENLDISAGSALEEYLGTSDSITFSGFTIRGLVYDSARGTVYAVGYYPSSVLEQQISCGFANCVVFDMASPNEPCAEYYNFNSSYYPAETPMSIVGGALIYHGDRSAWPTYWRMDLSTGAVRPYTYQRGDSLREKRIVFAGMYNGAFMYLSGYGYYGVYDLSSGRLESFSMYGITGGPVSGAIKDNTLYVATDMGGLYESKSTPKGLTFESYIDNSEIEIRDGMPIGDMEQLGLDGQGNIIFYDATQRAIRRININGSV